MNIEIPEMDQDLEEERNISTDKMKNVSRLTKDIDSLKKDNLRIVNAFSKNINARMGAFIPIAPMDSAMLKKREAMLKDTSNIKEASVVKTEVEEPIETVDDVLDLYQEWQKIQLMNSAKNSAANVLTSVSGKKDELDRRYKIHRLHVYSLHQKFALAFSCIILFFVGAPLGAIIRKGGLGLPMVVAIILFLTYYFLGVFAKNYSVEGNINPILGAWLPSLIMLPLGIYLTKRATADKGLMSVGNGFASFLSFFKKKKNKIAA